MPEQMALFRDPDPAGANLIPQGADGARRRDKGIKQSVDHAEDVHIGWSKKALDFLEAYAKAHHRFSCEMVRIEAKGKVPEPPSLRSWGSIMVLGSRKPRKWITQIDFTHVTNPKAHMANAAVWESLINET